MAKNRTWCQISLRMLLAGSVMAALGMLVHLERAKRVESERHLAAVLSGPHVRIHSPRPLIDEYWTQGTFSVSGQLYLPVGSAPKKAFKAEVRLLDPISGNTLLTVEDEMFRNGSMLDFNCDLHCEGLVSPGLYPVAVAVSDGGREIASAVTVMRFVDL